MTDACHESNKVRQKVAGMGRARMTGSIINSSAERFGNNRRKVQLARTLGKLENDLYQRLGRGCESEIKTVLSELDTTRLGMHYSGGLVGELCEKIQARRRPQGRAVESRPYGVDTRSSEHSSESRIDGLTRDEFIHKKSMSSTPYEEVQSIPERIVDGVKVKDEWAVVTKMQAKAEELGKKEIRAEEIDRRRQYKECLKQQLKTLEEQKLIDDQKKREERQIIDNHIVDYRRREAEQRRQRQEKAEN